MHNSIISSVITPRHIVQLFIQAILNLSSKIYPTFANSVALDQLASEEADLSGSALFIIKYVNFNQHPGSSNLIG